MEYNIRLEPVKLKELLGSLSDIGGGVIGMCFGTYVDVVCAISEAQS